MEYWVLGGGNLGNTREILSDACNALCKVAGKLVYKSSYYESEAWGFESANFINQLFIVESNLYPDDLMIKLLEIEADFGRTRTNDGYQARTLDLDILFAGNLVYESDVLILPHPRMHIRKFALLPCLEYQACYMHPTLKQTLQDLVYSCEDSSSVVRI